MHYLVPNLRTAGTKWPVLITHLCTDIFHNSLLWHIIQNPYDKLKAMILSTLPVRHRRVNTKD